LVFLIFRLRFSVGPFDTLGRAKWAAAPRAGVDREADREIADDTDNCGGDTGPVNAPANARLLRSRSM
jgi:hypothetical protein